MKTCHNCKYYKDYDGIFDWISSRIFGFPTLQKCFHPNRVKIVDYVNVVFVEHVYFVVVIVQVVEFENY